MQNEKSSGSDGLTVEFYKHFWELLRPDLTDTIKQSLSRGKLPASQREAIVTCLYKKGEPTDIRNWRPISLLNIDYKIMTKALANRLTKTLPHIISNEQTAGIPGRTIFENLSYNRDILKYSKENEVKGCVVSVDQVKAFDRVDWNYMLETLKKFGFGDKFISYIKTLYTDITIQVKTNGNLSQKVYPSRGVRQGCPISMLLYIIQAEIFALKVKLNKRIKGLKILGQEEKVNAFADDTNFYIQDEISLEILGRMLEQYEQFSGAKLNRDKCQGMWIGSDIGRYDGPLGFDWTKDKIKILGIIYKNDGEEVIAQNWNPVFDSMHR